MEKLIAQNGTFNKREKNTHTHFKRRGRSRDAEKR